MWRIKYLLPLLLSTYCVHGQQAQDFMEMASNFMQQAAEGKGNFGELVDMGNLMEGKVNSLQSTMSLMAFKNLQRTVQAVFLLTTDE